MAYIFYECKQNAIGNAQIAIMKTWPNSLKNGSYKIMMKTHNCTMDYMLHLSSNVRLIVEWGDKSQMINCREEPLSVPVPEPIKVEPEKPEQQGCISVEIRVLS